MNICFGLTKNISILSEESLFSSSYPTCLGFHSSTAFVTIAKLEYVFRQLQVLPDFQSKPDF